jgi:hypothetical protein
MDFWRNTKLLTELPTGDIEAEEKELRSLLARDEAEEERRNEVRRFCGAKRAVMDWKRECDILTGCTYCGFRWGRMVEIREEGIKIVSSKSMAQNWSNGQGIGFSFVEPNVDVTSGDAELIELKKGGSALVF